MALGESVEHREQLVEDHHHLHRTDPLAVPGEADEVGEQHGDVGKGVGDHLLTGLEPGSDRGGQHVEQQPLGSLLLQLQSAAAAHRLSQHQHRSEHGRIRHGITQQRHRCCRLF
jgi:hypothetical protein